MELNSITLDKFTENADYIYTKALKSIPREAYNSGIFKVVNIGANSGDTRVFTEMDHEEYAGTKSQGDQAERAQVQVGYSQTVTTGRIGKDIGITVEMRKYNKYPEVISMLTNLGEYCSRRMDLDLTHRLTFGTATTYTNKEGATVSIDCGDDTALFDSTHDLAGSATTYRTILANNPILSKGAMEAAELLMVQRYNNLGELKSIVADRLFTSNDPNTVNTAREYLQSTADLAGDNPGVVNVYKAKFTHVILPRLATTAAGAYDSDKTKYWGITSSSDSTAYIGVWEQPFMLAPTVGDGIEFSTENWNYGTRASYGIGIVSAHWVAFSKGDGAA